MHYPKSGTADGRKNPSPGVAGDTARSFSREIRLPGITQGTGEMDHLIPISGTGNMTAG
ncbi:MAG: hypothetical protein Q7T80_00920 [Methanoregula sp.]|nr:hypothetical protein [Methanoregula sp.]